MSMSRLRDASISRDCFGVKTAIATFVVRSRSYLYSYCVDVAELLFDSLPRVLSSFDCSFQDNFFPFFYCCVVLLCYWKLTAVK